MQYGCDKDTAKECCVRIYNEYAKRCDNEYAHKLNMCIND